GRVRYWSSNSAAGGGADAGGSTASGACLAFAAAFFTFAPAFAPAWARVNGRTPRARRLLSQVASSSVTVPGGSRNCRSMAAWLEGMRPYSHFVAVRDGISQRVGRAVPNSSTSLTAWTAPQTYRASPGSTFFSAR